MDAFPGITDATLVIALLIAAGAGAIIALICTLRAHRELDRPLSFPKNAELRHYAHPRDVNPLIAVAVLLAIVALTSWASERDRVAKIEERRAADAHTRALKAKPLTVSINQHGIVEVAAGDCAGVANVARGTTWTSCAE